MCVCVCVCVCVGGGGGRGELNSSTLKATVHLDESSRITTNGNNMMNQISQSKLIHSM